MSNQTFYHFAIPLIAGYILDLFLGDPLWLPHPIRLFGRLIIFFEKISNSGHYKIAKGLCLSIILISLTWLFFYLLIHSILPTPVLYYTITILFVFYGLANRSLISEVYRVNRKLTSEGLEAGRKQLSYIVGRNTANLTENQIRTASLETLSENLSDGVIAPLFYYAIGGVPLMMAYKMINTLDSMIGYKTKRYKDFGLIAARIDDLANYLPARITAFLMILVTFSSRGLVYIFKYGNKHSSPNSGYPEAALAGILNCQFGGPNIYHGQLVEKPFIGINPRIIPMKWIKISCLINLVVSFTFILLILIVNHFLNFKPISIL